MVKHTCRCRSSGQAGRRRPGARSSPARPLAARAGRRTRPSSLASASQAGNLELLNCHRRLIGGDSSFASGTHTPRVAARTVGIRGGRTGDLLPDVLGHRQLLPLQPARRACPLGDLRRRVPLGAAEPARRTDRAAGLAAALDDNPILRAPRSALSREAPSAFQQTNHDEAWEIVGLFTAPRDGARQVTAKHSSRSGVAAAGSQNPAESGGPLWAICSAVNTQ